MKTEAVGYCRVSSKGQEKDGSGLDRQEDTIRAFAKQNNYKLVQVYREAFTGTETDRPIFECMIADLLTNGCRTIIIEIPDRLARDLAVQLQLIALLASKGITLISAMTGIDITSPSDPMTKSMIQIMGSFAELDKNLLVRKLKKGRESARAKSKDNKCEGRKPFGYYEGEKAALARIKRLCRKVKGEDRKGPYDIAKILNAEKVPTRSKKPWIGATVSGIIKRSKRNGWQL